MSMFTLTRLFDNSSTDEATLVPYCPRLKYTCRSSVSRLSSTERLKIRPGDKPIERSVSFNCSSGSSELPSTSTSAIEGRSSSVTIRTPSSRESKISLKSSVSYSARMTLALSRLCSKRSPARNGMWLRTVPFSTRSLPRISISEIINGRSCAATVDGITSAQSNQSVASDSMPR